MVVGKASLQSKARAALGRFPNLYIAVQRLRYRNPFGEPNKASLRRLLCDETEIVIEGFPRSANSWTVRVFRHWQGRRIRIAEHQHSEAQILAGCRRGLPVIVLIRKPQDSIRSWDQYDPALDLGWALRRWIAFYSAVEKVADQVVIATFEQATEEFGSVVQQANAKFSTRFLYGEITDKLREAVTSKMAVTARPDPERREHLQDVTDRLDPAKLLCANALYERLAARSQNRDKAAAAKQGKQA
ncbi:hypothetical protein FGU71_02115 [Erythrobacter insulae]|uniref:Sulfotransferase family protein n=1 Tax=Erythrobacter insulae TaxID=2584124 RepID=A0A547P9G7_9SPHN|nr:hypothetical protein [Erythrobacter insulae]TRD10780.1 hypothetical protein FGU71_02115 [Erythrobacter insulae]